MCFDNFHIFDIEEKISIAIFSNVYGQVGILRISVLILGSS